MVLYTQKSMGRLRFTMSAYGTIIIGFLIATIIINPAHTTWFNLMLFSIGVMGMIPVVVKFIGTFITYLTVKRQIINVK